MFLENLLGNFKSKADNPYLGSLTIFVWVMPVSVLLFFVGAQQLAVLLSVISASKCCWNFCQKIQEKRKALRLVPIRNSKELQIRSTCRVGS